MKDQSFLKIMNMLSNTGGNQGHTIIQEDSQEDETLNATMRTSNQAFY